MNRSKIDWCTHVWNPFAGCSNACPWCYARKFAKRIGSIIACEKCSRFEFHFHPERMDAALKVKKPSIVFLGSMCDLFCDAAKDFVVEGDCGRFRGKYKNPGVFVQQWATIAPQHQYIVLTKSPQNIPWSWNESVPNLWVGVSDTGGPAGKHLQNILLRKNLPRSILCFEPLLEEPMLDDIGWFDWIIVGGLTGSRKRTLSAESVKCIVGRCVKPDTPVFLKRNLSPEVPMAYIMGHRESPPELAEIRKGKEKP